MFCVFFCCFMLLRAYSINNNNSTPRGTWPRVLHHLISIIAMSECEAVDLGSEDDDLSL